MTKARQKGVRKVNEMKIKVREPSGDHQGYIEWIEKFDFGNLLVEDRRMTKNERKNDEERRKIFAKSLTKTSRKHYGSASTWIFFMKTTFLTNFKWSSATRRVERFCSSHLPLSIGKRGRSLPPCSLLEELPGRPKWAWLLFAPPVY